jgi:phosphonate transport system substrate-binding protein
LQALGLTGRDGSGVRAPGRRKDLTMSETTGSSSSFSASDPTDAKKSGRDFVRVGLYGCLAAALATVGYLLVRANQDQEAMQAGQRRLLLQHGVSQSQHKKLATGFGDTDGNLIADPPGDITKRVAPDELIVAYYTGDDDETVLVDWKGLAALLEQATGKHVACREYENSSEEISEIKAGATHIVALHAADTPYLVNHAGFVPVAVLGNESGPNGNHLNLAVHAKSAVKSLADLRGLELICTRPDSITGYRAAIAVLLHETGMRPDVDYNLRYSHGQTRSIRGLVDGEFQAAALSDDKVQSMLKDGSIQKSDFRVIYESEVIPRLTIGHIHSLQPELVVAISQAILAFANEGATPAESTGKPLRFIPVNYKQDFAFVRRIDDAFDPRFGKRVVAGPTP